MVSQFKPALSFEKQLELMKSRGLIVKDEKKALKILSRVNYYKLSGYSFHLKIGDNYKKGTTFEDIYSIYMFNKKLSILLIDLLESVEGHFKTSFANVLAQKHGADAHVLSSIYANQNHFNSFIRLYNREKNKQSNIRFIQHNINKYGELPIWVAIEILSFGPISKLYKNLNIPIDKKDISDDFLSQNNTTVTPYYLQNWLQVTGTLRNRCAHYSRLYNRTIPITVNLHGTYLSNEKQLSTTHIDRDSLFAAFLVVKRMVCKDDQWIEVMLCLDKLFKNYDGIIEIEKIGFPINWKEYLFPKSKDIVLYNFKKKVKNIKR